MSADKTTSFRLEQIEARLVTLGNRLHDVATVAHECKLKIEDDKKHGEDRETRLRLVETYIEQQQGKEMQNRVIMGVIAALVSICGGVIVEVLARHF